MKYKIKSVRISENEKGLSKWVTLDNGIEAVVDGKDPMSAQVLENATVDGVLEKKVAKSGKDYYKLSSANFASTTAKSREDSDRQRQEGIAYFNSLNSAIAVVGPVDGSASIEEWQERYTSWRDFFLSEWKKYEADDYENKHLPFNQ